MADYNFDNKEVDDIVASYTAYKGKYTTASRKLELLLDLQSKNYSAVTATNINDQLAKTERVFLLVSKPGNEEIVVQYRQENAQENGADGILR